MSTAIGNTNARRSPSRQTKQETDHNNNKEAEPIAATPRFLTAP